MAVPPLVVDEPITVLVVTVAVLVVMTSLWNGSGAIKLVKPWSVKTGNYLLPVHDV